MKTGNKILERSQLRPSDLVLNWLTNKEDMAGRKFKVKDVVKLTDKAAAYNRKHATKKNVVHLEVSSYYGGWDAHYKCRAFDAAGKHVRDAYGNELWCLKSNHIDHGTKRTQIEALKFQIGENNKQMEKLQGDNQKIEAMIRTIQELGVDSLDNRAYTAAKKLVEEGKFQDVKTAYNTVIVVKEVLA